MKQCLVNGRDWREPGWICLVQPSCNHSLYHWSLVSTTARPLTEARLLIIGQILPDWDDLGVFPLPLPKESQLGLVTSLLDPVPA